MVEKKLREERKNAGLSMAEAARLTGTPYATWQGWEAEGTKNARRPPAVVFAWLGLYAKNLAENAHGDDCTLTISIPGPPVAQSRPRFARIGNGVRAYDAAPSRDYKSWVKCCAIDAMQASGLSMFQRDIPLEMTVDISLQRPKTLPKRVIHPTKKPDCSNVLKGIEDALELIAYEADQQIVNTRVKKRYGVPGVTVGIRQVE